MFNMGFGELVLLAVIGLLVIGPEQLPHVARKVARLLNELKRATDEVLNPVETAKRNVDTYLNRQINLDSEKEKAADKIVAKADEPESVKPVTEDLPKGHGNE